MACRRRKRDMSSEVLAEGNPLMERIFTEKSAECYEFTQAHPPSTSRLNIIIHRAKFARELHWEWRAKVNNASGSESSIYHFKSVIEQRKLIRFRCYLASIRQSRQLLARLSSFNSSPSLRATEAERKYKPDGNEYTNITCGENDAKCKHWCSLRSVQRCLALAGNSIRVGFE